MFEGPLNCSIIKRAKERKLVDIEISNIRDFALDKHKTVDDRPYGGGVGMVMRVDVIDRAMSNVKCPACAEASAGRQMSNVKERTVLLNPKGKLFDQKTARRFSKLEHLILICGHYEGVDERVRKFIDEEISIGDYILTGGEIPAMVIVDSIVRLIPRVLTKEEATRLESFSPYPPVASPPRPTSPGRSSGGRAGDGRRAYTLLEYPQYTRPPIYKNLRVPKILLSGNHEKIKKWRQKIGERLTKKLRPDLFNQKG